MSAIDELIERVAAAKEPNNALDMDIDIALFRPDSMYVSVRKNSAGTKLVYRRTDGCTETYWAKDHTLNDVTRALAIADLAALKDQTP